MPNQIHARPDYDKEELRQKKYHQNINNNISTAVWTTLPVDQRERKDF
jgi:hypothetical protein